VGLNNREAEHMERIGGNSLCRTISPLPKDVSAERELDKLFRSPGRDLTTLAIFAASSYCWSHPAAVAFIE
jgi:hypothetical protein